MAAVIALGAITFDTNTGNKAVIATPTLGDLIVIFAAATGVASGITVTDNNPDGHGTYSAIRTQVKASGVDSMTAFVRADVIRSATSTTFTAVQAASTGGGLQVYRVTGMTIAGLAAIRASGGQSEGAAAATPAPAFAQAALTGNPVLGAVFNATSPAGMTVPASWAAEDSDVGYAVPTAGIQTCHRDSGETGSTITWGSASASIFADIILELDSRIGQAAYAEAKQFPAVQACKRGAFF